MKMQNTFNNNTYKQPISDRALKRGTSLIVIACVLLLLTIAILCISLASGQISIFEQ